MFGNKSFLKLGMLDDSSIMGLYKSGYELEKCQYSFSQGVNNDGKPQTNVRGGSIRLTISGIPSDEILEWAMSSRKYHDGTIVICDDLDMPLEKIRFTNACCIGLEIDFARDGKNYICSNLILQVMQIVVGNTELNNRWIGF